jgi:extradiol dioxygenase family protein
MRPFHLAFPVDDLEKTREFYINILGCREGRSSDRWIDFDMYGHQVVAHLIDKVESVQTNPVDGDDVPASHFGVILDMEDWESLSERLKSSGMNFIIEPHIRFKGEAGEQATMFFLDPCGNALEFKAFKNDDMIFATD